MIDLFKKRQNGILADEMVLSTLQKKETWL